MLYDQAIMDFELELCGQPWCFRFVLTTTLSQHLTIREHFQGFACGQNQSHSVMMYTVDSDVEICMYYINRTEEKSS